MDDVCPASVASFVAWSVVPSPVWVSPWRRLLLLVLVPIANHCPGACFHDLLPGCVGRHCEDGDRSQEHAFAAFHLRGCEVPVYVTKTIFLQDTGNCELAALDGSPFRKVPDHQGTLGCLNLSVQEVFFGPAGCADLEHPDLVLQPVDLDRLLCELRSHMRKAACRARPTLCCNASVIMAAHSARETGCEELASL